MHTKLERSIGIGALVAFAALILFSANTYPMGLVLVMCPCPFSPEPAPSGPASIPKASAPRLATGCWR